MSRSSGNTILMADVARYYYDARFRIAEDAEALRKLIAAVDWTNDLTPPQWAQWYGVALGFAPDLIVELGRGRGNSTAVFLQAAARLGGTRVVSLCQSYDWAGTVAARVARAVEPRFFDNLDMRMTDILVEDYDEVFGNARRVLLLWDAHGFEVAEFVLGDILPRLMGREHLVIMHDIIDNRYAGVSRSYEGRPLWKGSAWQQRTGEWGSRVNIGWMHSLQDQIVAISDFSTRNGLEIGSADHELAQFFGAHPDRVAEMRRVIGDEFFAMNGHWAFFSLNGRTSPTHFPAVEGRQPFAHRADVALEGAQLPATVVTGSQAWAFASAFKWRAPGAPSGSGWLRLRLQVEGGSIGVGLLDSSGTEFSVRRTVGAHARPVEFVLPVRDFSQPDRLVISNWAAAAPARVRIDELSAVW